MLSVDNIYVKYGSFTAVKGISFEVQNGEIFGILGPNGAGKSSTLKAIMGLVDYSGKIRLEGKEIDINAKNQIGYVPEEFMLIESLSPMEFFEYIASIRGFRDEDRFARLIYGFGIENHVTKPIAALSMGTKQKVQLVAALMHEPKLLIMDEPLNGLDAKSTRLLKELLKVHVEKGGSVLFSTHIMDIAEKLCDRIAVINNGTLVAIGTVQELRSMAHEEGTLEDIFLKLTGEDEDIRGIVHALSK